MKVQTRAVHFKADQKLLEYLDRKLQKLEQFFAKIVEADVYLKLENSGQIKDKIIELRLKVPGETLIVKDSNKTFEKSIDNAVEIMKRNLKRYKDKIRRK